MLIFFFFFFWEKIEENYKKIKKNRNKYPIATQNYWYLPKNQVNHHILSGIQFKLLQSALVVQNSIYLLRTSKNVAVWNKYALTPRGSCLMVSQIYVVGLGLLTQELSTNNAIKCKILLLKNIKDIAQMSYLERDILKHFWNALCPCSPTPIMGFVPRNMIEHLGPINIAISRLLRVLCMGV